MNRRFNFGGIALILTAVILGIFAVDFFRRLWIDWGNARGKLNVTSSTLDEVVPGTTDLTQFTSSQTTPSQTTSSRSTYSGESTSVSSTTQTTTVSMDLSNAQTISVNSSDVHTGPLLLIDAQHPLASTPSLKTFNEIKYDHIRLPVRSLQVNTLAVDSMVSMFNAFFASSGQGNVMIYATTQKPSAPAYQVELPERASGLSLDLAILNEAAGKHTPFVDNGAYAWLPKHCAEYGYILRYTPEKSAITGVNGLTWHYRYVGVPHALYMHSEEICLEEYINLVHSHPWDGEHLRFSFNEKQYEVFYVPASAEATTTVYYPMGMDVEVAGDNIQGFIVTCSKPAA